MSRISQLQITFVPAEDRLLMRVASGDNEEFRFWLTRRFVAALRPHLENSLSHRDRIRTQTTSNARRELLDFERQAAVQNADFETPFQTQTQTTTLPLGDHPVLLTQFQIAPRNNDALVLALRPESGSGIDLNLSAELVHSIVALLDKALEGAAWDLPAVTAPTPVAAPDQAQSLN